MSPIEHPTQEDKSNQAQAGDLSRRQLLKVLIATGGAITTSTMLPGKWLKPIVEVGVLPVHAQTSPVIPTPTPTPRPTPTTTPRPPVAIIGCFTFNATGSGEIGPSDTIQTFADIAPMHSGVLMQRTITLHQAGHPSNGVVDISNGYTDEAGRFQPSDYDLAPLNASVPISPGISRLTVLWEFVYLSDGQNTCLNSIDIVG